MMAKEHTAKPEKTLPLEMLKTLDICQEIHIYAEEIYLRLSELHQKDREISRIFGELAVDKCNLAEAFKMTGRLKGNGLSGISVSADAAAESLDRMKTLLKWIKNNPVSIAHALRFAIRMEESLEKMHLLNVVSFKHDQDMVLMTANLKKCSANLHQMTEEYMNMTLFDQDSDDSFSS